MKKLIMSNIGTAMLMGLVFSVTAWAAGLGLSTWTALVGDLSSGDLIPLTDVSDISGSTDGTSKYASVAQLDTYHDNREITSSDTDVTFNKNIEVDKAGDAEEVRVDFNSDAGYYSGFRLETAGSARWGIGKSVEAEGGANAGSNFVIGRFSDAGGWLSDPFAIERATGILTIGSDLVFTESADHACTPTAGKACLWVRSSDSALVLTESDGTDTVFGTGGSGFDGTYLDFDEQSSFPGSAAAAHGYLYVEDTVPSSLKYVNDLGTEKTVMTEVSDDTTPQLSGNMNISAYRIYSDSGNIVLRLPDNSGTYEFQIQDSDGVVQWSLDSNGTVGP